VTLRKSIEKQILKDAELLKTGAVSEVNWVVSQGRTGKNGFSNSVTKLFVEHGIGWSTK
jgi:hypothetical protein